MLLHIFLRTFASVLRNITFFKNQLETIMLKRMRVIFTLMLVLAAMGVNAQVTTSAISGKVTDEQNETVIGACKPGGVPGNSFSGGCGGNCRSKRFRGRPALSFGCCP